MITDRFDKAIQLINKIIPRLQSGDETKNIKVKQTKSYITYEATNLTFWIKIKLAIRTKIEGEFTVDSKLMEKSQDKIATQVLKNKVQFGTTTLKKGNLNEKLFLFHIISGHSKYKYAWPE